MLYESQLSTTAPYGVTSATAVASGYAANESYRVNPMAFFFMS